MRGSSILFGRSLIRLIERAPTHTPSSPNLHRPAHPQAQDERLVPAPLPIRARRTPIAAGSQTPLPLAPRIKRLALGAALALALTFPATFAQAMHEQSRRQEPSRWIITLYLGGAHTTSSRLYISQPSLKTELNFDGVHFEGRSFDPPLYYGIRGGYFPERLQFLGFEAEFLHMKVYADPQQQVRVAGLHRGARLQRELALSEIVQRYSISHGANLLLLNVVARAPLGRSSNAHRSPVMLAARFGLGPTIPHTESTIEGHEQEQYEWGRLAWQWAVGGEVHLWRGLYALGEYKFTRTRQRGAIFAGHAEALLRSHHGVFGLSYHF